MRQEKSIRLLAQAHIADSLIDDPVEIYLAGYKQAVEDLKKEKVKKEKALRVDKPGVPTFEEFWKAYNKTKDRKKSEEKWYKLSDEDKIAIMKHVPLYVKETERENGKYRKYPVTYLNNRSWENSIDTNEQQSSTQQDTFYRDRASLIARLNAGRGSDTK